MLFIDESGNNDDDNVAPIESYVYNLFHGKLTSGGATAVRPDFELHLKTIHCDNVASIAKHCSSHLHGLECRRDFLKNSLFKKKRIIESMKKPQLFMEDRSIVIEHCEFETENEAIELARAFKDKHIARLEVLKCDLKTVASIFKHVLPVITVDLVHLQFNDEQVQRLIYRVTTNNSFSLKCYKIW